jgi:hypothetical protein
MATHDRELIRQVGQRVLTLDRGRLLRDEMLPAGDLLATPSAAAREAEEEDA